MAKIRNYLSNLLREPSLDGCDMDDSNRRFNLHSEVLKRKTMLAEVFKEFHARFYNLADEFFPVKGLEIELGAGVAPMRDNYPHVLATDITLAAHLDKKLNAEEMDLQNATVRAFYAQNCLHHFPHPSRFFKELERTLVPGGGAIILEPFYGPLGSFLYKRLFTSEGFDKESFTWETPVTGPMNGANQALSYIIFERDKKRFLTEHPSLEIVHQSIMGNFLKYILSGGLNFRQLMPNIMTRPISVLENILSPFRRWFGLHHVIVIRKVEH